MEEADDVLGQTSPKRSREPMVAEVSDAPESSGGEAQPSLQAKSAPEEPAGAESQGAVDAVEGGSMTVAEGAPPPSTMAQGVAPTLRAVSNGTTAERSISEIEVRHPPEEAPVAGMDRGGAFPQVVRFPLAVECGEAAHGHVEVPADEERFRAGVGGKQLEEAVGFEVVAVVVELLCPLPPLQGGFFRLRPGDTRGGEDGGQDKNSGGSCFPHHRLPPPHSSWLPGIPLV